MKINKILFSASIVIASFSATHAQELGIRIGNVTAGEAAIDAIISAGEFNRVHANLSFGSAGVGADALWDFLYFPFTVENEKGFYAYAGAGPSILFGDPFALAAMSEAGVEYRFDEVPLSLSFDWRPTLVIIENTRLDFTFFGFNARYIF